MEFLNEHLLPGQLGHFFVLLAFVSAIFATIAFFKSHLAKSETESAAWLKLARTVFFIELFSLLTVFAFLYYICANHYYEYLYAYKHSSMELEPKYLLACIWEGQEGSFLLWAMWHAILGTVVILTAKKREALVMTVVNAAQVFLIVMLLGVYVAGTKVGSSPFSLTRNELEGAIFSRPNYLNFIKDGIGLNILLRNYWMVIHPPVLFLGFASTLIPVGFAFSSLVKKDWGKWVQPVLPWALFSGLALGTGIMMGGKWAYESLSFGGYWAWDPVENASFVPWLIAMAGLHCMVIYKSTGRALRASFVFTILAYLFVLYSTFLTRTGVLGDTSVHSFTEAGKMMNILIGIYVLGVTVPMFILFFRNYKNIPAIHKEENISAREFWMFIGSMILFLAGFFIIAVTSLPVYNNVFGINVADPPDREFTYNKVMVLVAIVVGVLTGAGQFLKYKDTTKKYFLSKIVWPVIISAAIYLAIVLFYPLKYAVKGPGFLFAINIALFACIFSVVANFYYIQSVLKWKMKAAGSAITHFGFTLMIAGMIISSGNKEVISDNSKTGLFIPFDKDPTGRNQENPMENLTLLKGVPTEMGKYTVTYVSDSASPKEKTRVFYQVHFVKKGSGEKSEENFSLWPDSYKMKDNNLTSNPDTRHYLTHDVFTYVSTISVQNEEEDTSAFKTNLMHIGDTAYYDNGYIVLNGIEKNPNNERFHFSDRDTALVADLTAYSKEGTSYKLYPGLSVSNMTITFLDDTSITQNMYVRFSGISNGDEFKIGVKEHKKLTDFIAIKAYVFPYINLVWLGLIIMAAGFLVSLLHRANAPRPLALVSMVVIVGALIFLFLFANA
ncbi:MAG: cytochrome c biogenesis protein CcsA [Chitinophagaceae bacterium]|nr:cytochrome c biogenesis protein CcsA [Chitinophagaceae bacterium]MCZ2397363.1 cytochrome c biogenesis protein CcsA [Chitinophagales bacterium]